MISLFRLFHSSLMPLARSGTEANKPKSPKYWKLGSLHTGCFFQSQFPDGLLSHLELLDLAAYSHGKVVHELDVPGNLEMGDPAPAKLLYLIGAGSCIFLELD